MWRVDIPLVEFYKICNEHSFDLGYHVLICLIARYGESPEIFSEIERNWTTFHDLTGSKVLFLFAGDHISDNLSIDYPSTKEAHIYSPAIAIPRQHRNLQFKKINFDRTLYKEPVAHLKRDHQLFDAQTLQVSNLRNYLDLSERSIPCLHFTNLLNGKTSFIKLNPSWSVTQILKYLAIEFDDAKIHTQIDASIAGLSEMWARLKPVQRYDTNIEKCTKEILRWFQSNSHSISAEKAKTIEALLLQLLKIDAEFDGSIQGKKSYFNIMQQISYSFPQEQVKWIKPVMQRYIDLSANRLAFAKQNSLVIEDVKSSINELENAKRDNIDKLSEIIEKTCTQSASHSSKSPVKLFISYRRSDSQGSTGRIFDRLQLKFGNIIFRDVDSIDYGDNFVQAIEDAVTSCSVLLAVIGKQWLSIKEPIGWFGKRRRLDNPQDYVRLEIATALIRKIIVIPILVEDAIMPTSKDLPENLKPLTELNAIKITNENFENDVKKLIGSLEGKL